MIRRFQIEDLIVQDSSGVVFRALDTDTGKTVAVRRFFPFGVDGGGLHADEQTAYNIALNRLAGLSHPSLRSVICGGCDPVDGIPYIATEWIEGEPLEPIIARTPITAESAVVLITQALDVCELLSHVLAEEAVWVETELNTIIVGSPESGRQFTFWISPLKWLGGNGENRGLESIITLTEEIMGWKGQYVNDQAGRGLGGWLKWLREVASTASLHEVRESLAASVGADPPAPARILVASATQPMIRSVKPASSKMSLIAAAGLLIAIAGLGGWLWKRQSAQSGVPPIPEQQAAGNKPASTKSGNRLPASPVSDEVARANQRAAELSAIAAGTDQQISETLAQQQAAVEKQGGVFSPDQRELLLQQANNEVSVEGVFEKFDYSQTKKTMYLLFAGDSGWNSARGSIMVTNAPADLTEAALQPLIGKKVVLQGKLEVQKGSSQERPLVKIKDRASIKVSE